MEFFRMGDSVERLPEQVDSVDIALYPTEIIDI